MPKKCRYALCSALLCKPQTLPSQQILSCWAAAHPIVPRAGSNPGQGKKGSLAQCIKLIPPLARKDPLRPPIVAGLTQSPGKANGCLWEPWAGLGPAPAPVQSVLALLIPPLWWSSLPGHAAAKAAGLAAE